MPQNNDNNLIRYHRTSTILSPTVQRLRTEYVYNNDYNSMCYCRTSTERMRLEHLLLQNDYRTNTSTTTMMRILFNTTERERLRNEYASNICYFRTIRQSFRFTCFLIHKKKHLKTSKTFCSGQTKSVSSLDVCQSWIAWVWEMQAGPLMSACSFWSFSQPEAPVTRNEERWRCGNLWASRLSHLGTCVSKCWNDKYDFRLNFGRSI